MAPVKTDGNQVETLGYKELAGRLDHLDAVLHSVEQRLAGIQDFIDEHRPALARGMALMDPGSLVRNAMGLKPKARPKEDSHGR